VDREPAPDVLTELTASATLSARIEIVDHDGTHTPLLNKNLRDITEAFLGDSGAERL
jgi:hypothetical protein